MARVITFSTRFPAYHPRAGQDTLFPQALWNSIDPKFDFPDRYKTKHHTIRAGHRWKVGDLFSPRYWSGRPYNSPQGILGKDTEVKKVWNFEIRPDNDRTFGLTNLFFVDGYRMYEDDLEKLAANDGLSLEDLIHWFRADDGLYGTKPRPCTFDGQIICWNDKIEYP